MGTMLISVFSGPLMRWNGWRKCRIYFSVLELRITLLNQSPQQERMKSQKTKKNHGKWWWTRNTSSCGGAQLQAPTFTSTEVSHVLLPFTVSRCPHSALFLLLPKPFSLGPTEENLPNLCFPLPDDKLFLFFLDLCHPCLALLLPSSPPPLLSF